VTGNQAANALRAPPVFWVLKIEPASGEIELGHVDRAWARIAPELQKYDTLTAIRNRYGVSAPGNAFAC
jgi:hypothetical protein